MRGRPHGDGPCPPADQNSSPGCVALGTPPSLSFPGWEMGGWGDSVGGSCPNQLFWGAAHPGQEPGQEPGGPVHRCGGQLVRVGASGAGGGQCVLRGRVPAPRHRTVCFSGAHLVGRALRDGFHLNTLHFEWSGTSRKKSAFLAGIPPALGVCPSRRGADVGSAMAGVPEASVPRGLLLITPFSAHGPLLFRFRVSSRWMKGRGRERDIPVHPSAPFLGGKG